MKMLKDVFIIFIILLLLLMFISTLGGSIRFNMEKFVPAAAATGAAAACTAGCGVSAGGAGGIEHFATTASDMQNMNDMFSVQETYVRLPEEAAPADNPGDEEFRDEPEPDTEANDKEAPHPDTEGFFDEAPDEVYPDTEGFFDEAPEEPVRSEEFAGSDAEPAVGDVQAWGGGDYAPWTV